MRKTLLALLVCSLFARLLMIWSACVGISQNLQAAWANLTRPAPDLRRASRSLDRARHEASALGFSLRTCLILSGAQWRIPAETAPAELLPLIDEAAHSCDLDRNLLLAIVRTESNFDPRALSMCGAQGLMQLMPYTASEFGCRDPYDPRQNLLAGCAYYHTMVVRFGDLSLSLAAAYAGPHSVEKYHGLPPYSEVDDYLRKVMLRYLSYSLGEG